jgi:hypothetical protein
MRFIRQHLSVVNSLFSSLCPGVPKGSDFAIQRMPRCVSDGGVRGRACAQVEELTRVAALT